MTREGMLTRRRGVLVLAASAVAAGAGLGWAVAQSPSYDLHMSRDAGCGCCRVWADILRGSGRFRVTVTDEPDTAAVKRRLGVPGDLASCHTALVEGYVVEGHVPAADILRLLETRPASVRGLAVAGMPIGSPGMEQPGAGRDAFDVVAFHSDGGRDVFAHYAAQS